MIGDRDDKAERSHTARCHGRGADVERRGALDTHQHHRVARRELERVRDEVPEGFGQPLAIGAHHEGIHNLGPEPERQLDAHEPRGGRKQRHDPPHKSQQIKVCAEDNGRLRGLGFELIGIVRPHDVEDLLHREQQRVRRAPQNRESRKDFGSRAQLQRRHDRA
eukprot:Amastigsp_a668_28.p5 type:complete len:164 gc:universal Amastigsp_a668_28:1520-1029(-)